MTASRDPLDGRENLARALTLGAVLLCAVYIVVRPLANQFEPYSGESAFAGLTLCLLGALCGFILLLDRNSALPSRIGLATVLWSGLLLWGAVRSPHQGRGLPYAADFAGYILLMLSGYVLSRRDARTFPLACRLLIAMALVEACAGLWQQWVDFPRMVAKFTENKDLLPDALQSTAGRARLSGGNVFGSFVYPNALGAYLALGTVLLSGGALAAHTKRGRVAMLAAVGSVLMALASYFTGSKGALLALLGGAWAWFVFRQSETNPARARLLYGLTAVGVIALVTVLLLATFGVLPSTPFGDSLQVRFEYWRSAFAMINMEKLQGVGLGGFAEHYSFFKTPLGTEAKEVHNDFLQLWTELGIAGLLGYIGVWVMMLSQRTTEFLAPAGDESDAKRFEQVAIAGALIAFLFMYVSFEPLTSIDLWSLLGGETMDGAVGGAIFAIAMPALFAVVLLLTRGMSNLRALSWAAKAAIAALLLHQLIDFDLRAQAVMGAMFLLGGMLLAQSSARSDKAPTTFERFGRVFPLALAAVLVPFSFWIPAQSGLARKSAEVLEEEAQELAAKGPLAAEDRKRLSELRSEVLRLREDAVSFARFDSEAWTDLAFAMEAVHWDSDAARRQAVESALTEAQERRPFSPVPMALLANFHARNGSWQRAGQWLSRARQHYPLHPGLQLWHGDTQLMLNDSSAAAEDYLEAFATDQKINDTNVRLSAIYTDPRAGVFCRHTREPEVFQKLERTLKTLDDTPETRNVLRGLTLRRMVALCALFRDAERSKMLSAAARSGMAAEIRATTRRFFELQSSEGQRAHAAFYVALSYETHPDPALAVEKKSAWERAKELHAEVKNTPTTEESLFERLRLIFDK